MDRNCVSVSNLAARLVLYSASAIVLYAPGLTPLRVDSRFWRSPLLLNGDNFLPWATFRASFLSSGPIAAR